MNKTPEIVFNYYRFFSSSFFFLYHRIPDPNTVDVPEECELVVNEKTCSVKVVMKSDNEKECSPI